MLSDGTLECRISGDYYSDFSPVWSPDGRFIAFISRYPLVGIFVMNSDGTNRRVVVGEELDFYYGRPTWSPDSKSLAFSKIFHDQSSKIYIASIEESSQLRFVTDSGFGQNYPA
jgi:Tol biopolymer transport system component